MDSNTALSLAILRLNADVQQTPHIFPLDQVQVAELREVIATLGDLQDAIQNMPQRELNYWRD